jgi:choline dehydrogenase-like flavoprotein
LTRTDDVREEEEHPHLENPPAQDRSSRGLALAAVCDAFLPGASGLPSASRLGVPARIRSELEALGRQSLISDLDRFLDTIQSTVFNLATTGRAARFTDLDPEGREHYLLRWAGSRIALKRRGFQVLKRLVLLYGCGQHDSPYWKSIGFSRPGLDPAADPPRLRMKRLEAGSTVDYDAVVIGSGAGGGVAAARLAMASRKVLVLERAKLVLERDMQWKELDAYADFYLDRGIASTEDRAIGILAGAAVGGGTLINWTTSLRLPERVRTEWRRHGIENLEQEYDDIQRRLHIDAFETAINGPNAHLQRGLERLKYSYRILPRNVDGCGDCGMCGLGCRRGAKQSTMRTYLVDACAREAEIADGAEAWRIELKGGRVGSVTVRVEGGEVKVRTPLVALAGGSILSPAVLLRSGIAEDRAGRNLHLHPSTAVVGIYEDDVNGWLGPPQSVIADQFADLEDGYGFIIECPSVPPGILSASLPWWGSQPYLDLQAKARRMAAFITLVRDRDPGRVDIDRDGAPRIHYDLGELEQRHLQRAMVEAARLHFAADAERVHTVHTPPLSSGPGGVDELATEIQRRGVSENRLGLFSAHQMGTCAMGTSPQSSVADPEGKVWGVHGLWVCDASAFPTASGVNPMLSVMALAMRTAEHMA